MKNPAELKALATHLRKIRAERDLSQQQLADMADIAKKTVTRIENANYAVSLDIVISIAKALDIPLKDFVNFKVKGK